MSQRRRVQAALSGLPRPKQRMPMDFCLHGALKARLAKVPTPINTAKAPKGTPALRRPELPPRSHHALFFSSSLVPLPYSSIINCFTSATMASRSFSKSVRSPLARQLAAPRVQQRTFVAARNLVRAGAVARPAMAGPAQQQVRGVKTIDFAGQKEDVYGTPCPFPSFRGQTR